MSEHNLHSEHQPRIRRRARVVSWVFAPLTLAGIAFWFLFNTVMCMHGNTGAWALWVCNQFNLLPDVLGIFLIVALLWLVFGLLDFGRVMGGDPYTAQRMLITRHAASTRYACRQLDDEYRSAVMFAMEMTGWAIAVALATLVYYWFELAFPLGLIVVAGLLSVIIRGGGRAISALRGRPTSTSGMILWSWDKVRRRVQLSRSRTITPETRK